MQEGAVLKLAVAFNYNEMECSPYALVAAFETLELHGMPVPIRNG